MLRSKQKIRMVLVGFLSFSTLFAVILGAGSLYMGKLYQGDFPYKLTFRYEKWMNSSEARPTPRAIIDVEGKPATVLSFYEGEDVAGLYDSADYYLLPLYATNPDDLSDPAKRDDPPPLRRYYNLMSLPMLGQEIYLDAPEAETRQAVGEALSQAGYQRVEQANLNPVFVIMQPGGGNFARSHVFAMIGLSLYVLLGLAFRYYWKLEQDFVWISHVQGAEEKQILSHRRRPFFLALVLSTIAAVLLGTILLWVAKYSMTFLELLHFSAYVTVFHLVVCVILFRVFFRMTYREAVQERRSE